MLDELVSALLLVVQPAPAPTPRTQRLVLDLARPGETRTERVASGQPFVVDVFNRAPGARYRLTAAGKSRLIESLRLDEIAGRWRSTAGCETAIRALADLYAVSEERDVQGLFIFGGAGDRIVRSRCPGSAEANQLISAALTILGAATSDGLAEGAVFELVVDRLLPTSETPVRTWRLRVEPQTLREASPDLTETAWLVEATARDILEMLLFAAGRGPGKEVRFHLARQQTGSPSFEVGVEGVGQRGSLTQHLALDGGIWSPAVYSGWATALARRLGVTRSAQAPPEPVAGRLTHPVASVLEAENQRISKWLGRDMCSPDAHEQAALLLSALALRESAGGFSDPRLTLCRMSAHLAVARALRSGSPASPDGALAEIAILALSKRQKDALDALGRLRAEDPARRPGREPSVSPAPATGGPSPERSRQRSWSASSTAGPCAIG